jgi:hypothetical protein
MKAKRMMVAIVVALGLLISAGAATETLAFDSGPEHDSIGFGRVRAPQAVKDLPHGPGVDEAARGVGEEAGRPRDDAPQNLKGIARTVDKQGAERHWSDAGQVAMERCTAPWRDELGNDGGQLWTATGSIPLPSN